MLRLWKAITKITMLNEQLLNTKKVDSMFLRVETVRTKAKEVCAMQVYK